jgi:hypothetical protein
VSCFFENPKISRNRIPSEINQLYEQLEGEWNPWRRALLKLSIVVLYQKAESEHFVDVSHLERLRRKRLSRMKETSQ